MVRFEIAESKSKFHFTGFDIEKIEGHEYLKIDILVKCPKEKDSTFSIYILNDDFIYDFVASLSLFQDVTENIYVVYRNSKLKFCFKF